VCTPLWTAGDTASGIGFSSPALVNGVVYIGRENIGGPGAGVFAFDAAGVTNCSGNPKNCTPLWQRDDIGIVQVSPAVANGLLYVHGDVLFAFRPASP
jgi:outer membrane protein assembly factor BamB